MTRAPRGVTLVATVYVGLHTLLVVLLSALPVMETVRPSDDANIGAGLSLYVLEWVGLPWSLVASPEVGGQTWMTVADLIGPWVNVALHAALWWWVVRRVTGLRERPPSA